MAKKSWKVLAVSFGVGVTICLVLLSTVILGGWRGGDGGTGSGIAERVRTAISLVKPVFAQEGQLAGTNFLQQEAGISAFVNVEREINLLRARGAFRTIERETDEYLIGSVAIPEKSEWWDVHVFVHRDGWIIAYYHRDRTTATIINWDNPAVTNLELALGKVATEAEVFFANINFYDFRFPRAESLMIILDTDSFFRMMIPKELTVYDRAFSFRVRAIGTGGNIEGSLRINETEISSIRTAHHRPRTILDSITRVALRPGVMHTITITPCHRSTAAAVIILTYSERQ